MAIALTEHDVKQLLPMRDLIDAMETALAAFSTGGAVQPLRTVMPVGQKAFFGVMPAHIANPPALGTKVVTVFSGNAERGLPTHLATILLFDPATGALMAALDGRYITEARTAAVSAVSARHLAADGSHDLAILGAGVQARSHLDALHAAGRLRGVRVWSRNPAHAERFAQEMSQQTGLQVEVAGSARQAVETATLIVLATASPTPVLEEPWVAAGAHLMAVGACRPDQREMTSELVARARVFVDSHAGALAEAGDLVIPIGERRFGADHIVGELGAVIAHRCAGRESATEVTLFKSLGMAVEDVAAAHLVYRRALAAGSGVPLHL